VEEQLWIVGASHGFLDSDECDGSPARRLAQKPVTPWKIEIEPKNDVLVQMIFSSFQQTKRHLSNEKRAPWLFSELLPRYIGSIMNHYTPRSLTYLLKIYHLKKERLVFQPSFFRGQTVKLQGCKDPVRKQPL